MNEVNEEVGLCFKMNYCAYKIQKIFKKHQYSILSYKYTVTVIYE